MAYCLICKCVTSSNHALIMPQGSDYVGQAVCHRCACTHFDRTIKAARNHFKVEYIETHADARVTVKVTDIKPAQFYFVDDRDENEDTHDYSHFP